MSNLSAIKKRWIEKWCLEVSPFLRDGSMCTVTGVYHEEDPHLIPQKGSACCIIEGTSRKSDFFQKSGKLSINGEQLCEPKTGSLPYVKLSYSHLSRRKLDKLVNGLPIISSGVGENYDEKTSPVMLTQQSPTDKLSRRQTTDISNYSHCDIIKLSPSSVTPNKHKNAFAANRSVSRARQKLLQKSSPSFKSRQLDNYTPIQNCWTSAEMTW